VTLAGEHDDGPDGNPRSCPAGTEGEVVSANLYPAQGWTYGVVFEGGVFVFLTAAELSDATQYSFPEA
jgi:hypothetical protein